MANVTRDEIESKTLNGTVRGQSVQYEQKRRVVEYDDGSNDITVMMPSIKVKSRRKARGTAKRP